MQQEGSAGDAGSQGENRRIKDALAARAMQAASGTVCVVGLIVLAGLLFKSLPLLYAKPLPEILFSSTWHPFNGDFGLFPFIMGTVIVTALSMVIAVPLSLLTAIYLAEYASKKARRMLKPLIDTLAGIPSVVFGLCGVMVFVPAIRWLGLQLGITTTGYSVLAGAIVLAIMVIPIIVSVSEEVLRTFPLGVREASLALGATRWQTVKHVVLGTALPGLGAAVLLGFTRAFGETMAVLMVVGNVAKIPESIFDPAYPLPALIANNYGEMMSIRMYDSALMFSALALFAVVLLLNITARLALGRIQGENA